MENVNMSYNNGVVSEVQKDFLSILPEGYGELGSVEGLSGLGIDALLGEIVSSVSGAGSSVLSFFLLLLGAVLLSALSRTLAHGNSRLVEGGVSAAVSVAVFSAMYPLFYSVTETLSALGGFFSMLAPILTSLIALGGGVGTASSAGYGMSITLWLTGIVAGGLLPGIMAAVFTTTALSVSLGRGSEQIAKGIGDVLARLMGIVGAATAAIFALQTYVSATADSLAMRAARYAAGSLIPTVGATVSGALSSLVGGLSYTGGLIGASSVAVIIGIAVSPLVILLLYRLAFYLASLVAQFIGGGARCVAAFGKTLDALISVYVMTTMIYIFEVLMLIWGGNKIFGA